MNVFKQCARTVFGLGPIKMLTWIMAPVFIAYGAVIALIGYDSPFIHVLGLPVWYYAALFIIAGMLKFLFLYLNRVQLSHTIGVSVSAFWSMAIFILSPNPAGALTAVPWLCIGLVCLFGAIWPQPPKVIEVPLKVSDLTDPTMRAIDYVERRKDRLADDSETT